MPSVNEKAGVGKPRFDLSKYTKGATSVADVTEQWVGLKPTDIDHSIQSSKDLKKVEMEDLVGKRVTVLGMQKRKGQEGPFVVALGAIDGHDEPIIFVTGGRVILEKLDTVAEKEEFPVVGTITHEKAKNGRFSYFNIVA